MTNGIGISSDMSVSSLYRHIDTMATKSADGGDTKLKLSESRNPFLAKLRLKAVKQDGPAGTIGDNRDMLGAMSGRLSFSNSERNRFSQKVADMENAPFTVANLRSLLEAAVPPRQNLGPAQIARKVNNLVADRGVTLSPVAGETVRMTGDKVNVDVTVRDGSLHDQGLPGYVKVPGDDSTYSGDNIAPPHNTPTVRNTYVGTHSMGPCYPVIMILRDPDGNRSVSLNHHSGIATDSDLAIIETHKNDGFEVEKVIVGVHGTKNNSAQNFAAVNLAQTLDGDIDFGVIKYNDRGVDSWWVSADVTDNDNVKIDIGSDSGLPQNQQAA